MDALEHIESQAWLYNLTPRKREVVCQVQLLHQRAYNNAEIERQTAVHLRVAAQQALRISWPISDDEDVLTFFEPLKSYGCERGIDDDGVNHHGIIYWVNAISTVDYAHLPLQLREYAVLPATASIKLQTPV